MPKKDPLLIYVILALRKLGGKMTITKKDTDICKGQNLCVVMSERGEQHELTLIDTSSGHQVQPISPHFYSKGAMHSGESIDAELTDFPTE